MHWYNTVKLPFRRDITIPQTNGEQVMSDQLRVELYSSSLVPIPSHRSRGGGRPGTRYPAAPIKESIGLVQRENFSQMIHNLNNDPIG